MAIATHYPACGVCGSTDVAQDAWATFDPLNNAWVLGGTWQEQTCRACGSTNLILKPYTEKERIRLLNDALRVGTFRGEHDQVVMTAGVSAEGDEFVQSVIQAVREFADFNPNNDPYQEHDFGKVEVDGETIFFKHDYYDLAMTGLSPNPADPTVTARVLTIMLSSEY